MSESVKISEIKSHLNKVLEDLTYSHVDDATKDKFEISVEENVQLLDKKLVNTGILTPKDKENILSITNGDNLTYLMGEMYKFWILHGREGMDQKGRDAQFSDRNVRKMLEKEYRQAQNYNPDVLPIEGFDAYLKTMHPIEFAEAIDARDEAMQILKKIPTVYLRNLKGEIRTPRDAQHMKYGLVPVLKDISSKMRDFERLSDDKKEMYFKKLFSSEFKSFEQVRKNLDKLDVLFLNHEEGIDEVKSKLQYAQQAGDAKILYENNDVLVVAVLTSDGMKELSCGSTWCFSIESTEEYWNQYTENGQVNLVYNFNLSPEDKKRMVVVVAGGEVYNMYNEYMDDGYQYLQSIGAADHLTVGNSVVHDIDEDGTSLFYGIDGMVDEVVERIMGSMPGSLQVDVKKKCRLGGSKKPCNKGDMNNFNFAGINEAGDPAFNKWKRANVSYRGISPDADSSGENGGMAMLGQGLYSVPASNKSMARGYGKLTILVNAIPKKPKVFNTLNDWEIWFQQNVVLPISKAKGKDYPDARDVNSISEEMMKLGYDGIIIKGREYVNYKPEDVRYYHNDRQLEMYYYDFVAPQNPINENHRSDLKYGVLMADFKIENWSKITSIIDKEDIYDKAGFGLEKNPHITVLYGFHGDVNGEEVLERVTDNIEGPIEAELIDISIFESKDFDVVKFGAKSKELTKLNKVCKEFPFTSDYPDYHPHMTIAYVKKGMGKKYAKKFSRGYKIQSGELVFSSKDKEQTKAKIEK